MVATQHSAKPRHQFDQTGHEKPASDETGDPEHRFLCTSLESFPQRGVPACETLLEHKVSGEECNGREHENDVVDAEQRRPCPRWKVCPGNQG